VSTVCVQRQLRGFGVSGRQRERLAGSAHRTDRRSHSFDRPIDAAEVANGVRDHLPEYSQLVTTQPPMNSIDATCAGSPSSALPRCIITTFDAQRPSKVVLAPTLPVLDLRISPPSKRPMRRSVRPIRSGCSSLSEAVSQVGIDEFVEALAHVADQRGMWDWLLDL